MSKSMKAALLSALVVPGAGHIYLKKYIAGVVLLGVAIIPIYYLVTTAITRALEITDKIQSGEVPLDVAAITELVAKQATGSEAQMQTIATTVFIISWLIGIIHSYRVGRVLDKNSEADVDYIEL